jgi:hypothetical protein
MAGSGSSSRCPETDISVSGPSGSKHQIPGITIGHCSTKCGCGLHLHVAYGTEQMWLGELGEPRDQVDGTVPLANLGQPAAPRSVSGKSATPVACAATAWRQRTRQPQ